MKPNYCYFDASVSDRGTSSEEPVSLPISYFSWKKN